LSIGSRDPCLAAEGEPDLSVLPARGVCAITGASGYVGSRVANHLANAGWDVRALSRSAASTGQPSFTRVHFELGDEPAPRALADAGALVHVAYDFDATHWHDIERVNVEGSRRLFAAARDAGVERIVLVSTTAAFPGARSHYGRAKLEIERAALDAGGTVVRPGLVWGPQGAAMFGALQRMVELPIVPLPIPPALELTMVHEDDLAVLMEQLLEQWPASSGRLLVAAATQTLTFAELLRSLALRAQRRPRFARLPWRVVWLGLRMLEAAGVTPPFRSDSLLSLVASDDDPLARATDGAERYGVRFRPYLLGCRS
jgi:nucleoside-diphosphate-sugar epimerase